MKPYNWLKYYRNSLADGEMLNIKASEADNGTFFTSVSSLDSTSLVDLYKKYSKGEEKETEAPIEISIAPFFLSRAKEHGKTTGEGYKIYPYWIPAILHKDGVIKPPADENRKPWFMRSVLEPVVSENSTLPILSSVESLDHQLESFIFDLDNWEAYWQSAEMFFQNITEKPYRTFVQSGYSTFTQLCIIKAKKVVVSNSLLHLYDELRKQDGLPSLIYNLLDIKNGFQVPLPNKEALFLKSGHYGQFNNKFPLNLSQRIALMSFEQEGKGKTMAVNGPPGTGKTTLLQSIVANEVVKAALKGQKPPVLLASSTNNQAITNILDSFGGSGPALERWIPNINSLGSFLISNDPKRQSEALAKGYQILTKSQEKNLLSGYYLEHHHQAEIAGLIEYYTERYQTYTDTIGQISISQITKELKQGIQQVCHNMDFIFEVFSKISPSEETLLYEQLSALQSSVVKSRDRLAELNAENRQLLDFWKQFNSMFSNSLAKQLLTMIPTVKKDQEQKLALFLKDSPFRDLKNLKTKGEVQECLLGLIDQVEAQTQKEEKILTEKEQGVNALNDLVESLEKAKSLFNDPWEQYLAERPKERFSLEENYRKLPFEQRVNMVLDLTLRHQAFVKSVHYWEGMWLLKQEGSMDLPNMGIGSKPETIERISYLTPLFISTFQSIPSFCSTSAKRGNTFSTELFDLLIVDEAGQVSPEIGVGTFSLAQKALVVGDIYQIEPVWNVTSEQSDKGNLKEAGILKDNEYDALKKLGLTCTKGSLMHLAQRASTFQVTENLGGALLSEHRRCCDELVAFSNDCVYQGLLQPMRGLLGNKVFKDDTLELSLPPLGYLHVHGVSEKGEGGSLVNKLEAEAIVAWLMKYQGLLTDGKPQKLSERLAIITPFAAQKKLITSLIKKNGLDTQITVGTVHQLQGAEREMVIFSPTYGINHKGSLFFDRGFNMLNVALTRAKNHFIVMGNMALFNPKLNKIPTGALANYLFSDEQNELSNAFLFESKKVNADNERIASLEKHRNCLKRVFEVAEKRIIIVSPFISINAIEVDGIASKIREAINKGTEVLVYTDKDLDAPNGKLRENAHKGRKSLKDAGATLKVVERIHNKSIAVDDNLLVEGSFNWLSASRDPEKCRHEVSHCLKGDDANPHIKQLLQELSLK